MPNREPLSYRELAVNRNPGMGPMIDRGLAKPNAPRQIQLLSDATYSQPTPGMTLPTAAQMAAKRQQRTDRLMGRPQVGLTQTELANDRFETKRSMSMADEALRAARINFYKNPKDAAARMAMAQAQDQYSIAQRSFLEADRLGRRTVADLTPEQFQAGRDSLQRQADAILGRAPADLEAMKSDIYARTEADKVAYGRKIEPMTQAFYGTSGLPEGAGVREQVARSLINRSGEDLREKIGDRAVVLDGKTVPQMFDERARRQLAEAEAMYARPKGGKIQFEGDYASLSRAGADQYAIAADNTRKRVGERMLAEQRAKDLDATAVQATKDALTRDEREFKLKEAGAKQDMLESAAKIGKLEAETRAAIMGLPSVEYKAGTEKLQLRKMELENKLVEKQIRDFGLEGLSTSAVAQVGSNWLTDVKNMMVGYEEDRTAAAQNLDAAVSELEVMASSEPEKAKVFAGSIIRRMKSIAPQKATLSQSILAGAGLALGNTGFINATRADRAVQAAKVDAYLERLKAIAGEAK